MGDLTEDENLGKGTPAFECWRTEAVRDQQKYGCFCFLCVFTKVNQRVRVWQQNITGKEKMCVPKASWHRSIFMFSLSFANDINLQMVDAE